jgi:hypothetical protein|tara:strand:- start:2087 stop:3808 length:1722 start_codon:yes stop_codon:yes gene_type:complete
MIDFKKFDKTFPTPNARADAIFKHLASLKDKRHPFLALWDVENRLFLPRRYDLLRQDHLRHDRPGQQYGAQIYDGHPANAANKFALGILSYMVSRSTPWMRLVPAKRILLENDDVKKYFQNATTQVLWSFNQSNFYGESVWFTKDATVTGTAYNVAEENLETGAVNYQTVHPGDCYLEDDWSGKAAIFIRFPVMLTAMAAVDKFGADSLPAKVVQDARGINNGNPFNKSKYMMAVYRNNAEVKGSIRPEDMPYKVFWILVGDQPRALTMVQESGWQWFTLTWRMGKESGQSYGTSLAADALTEGLQVNKLGQKTMEMAHMAVNPPTVQPETLRRLLNLRAGGRTFTPKGTSPDSVREVFGNNKWPIGDAEMERIHNSLDDKFFIRFFEMLTSRDVPANITAFQIQQMVSEKAILMGAMVGAFEQEYLKNAIDIQFAHEEKAGRLPDPPDILFEDGQGQTNLDIAYEGPLAKMQTTLLESKPILDGLGLMQAIGNIWPNSLIKVNEMKLIEDAGISVGMSQDLFKDDREVVEIMTQVNAQDAREQELLEAESAAKQIPALTGAVDETSILANAG